MVRSCNRNRLDLRVGEHLPHIFEFPGFVQVLPRQRRPDIEKHLWPEGAPEEIDAGQQINTCIRLIRRCLNDNARAPTYIAAHKGGYQFIAPITIISGRNVVEVAAGAPDPAEPVPERRSKRSRWWILVPGFAAIVAVLALLFSKWLFPRRYDVLPPTEPVRMGRVLVRQTSEGRSLRRIPLSHPSEFLAVSPDGKKVYATNRYGRILSIVSTADFKVRELPLPQDAGPMAISTDGKLYIGSPVEGLMVLDTAKDQLLPGTIPTGGPVSDMAMSPDGEKLFLAMDKAGLKRLSIKGSKLSELSNRICPLFLKVDPQGRHLYVTYQCTSKAGHNPLEIFDVASEELLATVSGPPMVGGDLAVSPDGRLVLIDGWNACEINEYDHVGCPPIPGHIYHLFRPADRQILNTFTFPHSARKACFLDDSRFLLTGESLAVVDAVKSAVKPAPRGPRTERGLGATHWRRNRATSRRGARPGGSGSRLRQFSARVRPVPE
jgi:hypothetical protein